MTRLAGKISLNFYREGDQKSSEVEIAALPEKTGVASTPSGLKWEVVQTLDFAPRPSLESAWEILKELIDECQNCIKIASHAHQILWPRGHLLQYMVLPVLKITSIGWFAP